MKEIKNHPFIDGRTVKAYETKNGTYMQICDTTDINVCHGCYSVEYERYGGLDCAYQNRSLDKCISWIEQYGDEY